MTTENRKHSYNLRNKKYKLSNKNGNDNLLDNNISNNNGAGNGGDLDDYINIIINSENKNLLLKNMKSNLINKMITDLSDMDRPINIKKYLKKLKQSMSLENSEDLLSNAKIKLIINY